MIHRLVPSVGTVALVAVRTDTATMGSPSAAIALRYPYAASLIFTLIHAMAMVSRAIQSEAAGIGEG